MLHPQRVHIVEEPGSPYKVFSVCGVCVYQSRLKAKFWRLPEGQQLELPPKSSGVAQSLNREISTHLPITGKSPHSPSKLLYISIPFQRNVANLLPALLLTPQW